MTRKGTEGFALVLGIIVVLVLVVGAAAASYYLLWSQQALPQQVNKQYTTKQTGGSTIPTMKPISDSDGVSDIEAELTSTSEGSIDTDIKELNSSLNSL